MLFIYLFYLFYYFPPRTFLFFGNCLLQTQRVCQSLVPNQLRYSLNSQRLISQCFALGLVHTYPFLYGIFFFNEDFSLPHPRKRRFRPPKTQVFKHGPQSGDFWTSGWSFSFGRTKTKTRRFSNTMVSFIIFVLMDKKTSWVTYAWMRTIFKNAEKYSLFQYKIYAFLF